MHAPDCKGGWKNEELALVSTSTLHNGNSSSREGDHIEGSQKE